MFSNEISEIIKNCTDAFKSKKISETEKIRADIDYIAMMCDIVLEEDENE